MNTLGNSEVFTAEAAVNEPPPDYVIGVLQTLSAENSAIRNLFSKINIDAQSVNTRRRYLPMLFKAITVHLEVQRRVLLPALLTPEILEPLAKNVLELPVVMQSIATQPLQRWQAAQRVVMRKLELVERTPPTKFVWRGNFDALTAAMEQCIEEEQQVVFPFAAKTMTPLKLLSLDIRHTRELGTVLAGKGI